MKLTTAILAGAGLASAAVPQARPVFGRMALAKRWDYDVCSSNCAYHDVPMPDKDNFGLPLEDYYSEQCPPLIVGPYNAPSAVSRACLDFQGPNLYFNFSQFPGYTLTSAAVAWKVKGIVGQPSTWTLPPPTTNLVCDSDFKCRLPFSDILGVSSATPLLDLMAGMCPLGDREALILFLQLSGTVEPIGGGAAVSFVQQYPCTSRLADRSCTAWDSSYPYIEVAYRCSKCEVAACPSSTTTAAPSTTTSASTTTTTTTTAPPSVQTCGLGTAFGYLPGGSTALNTLSGQGCNRWGWYFSPTLANLQAGISGILYVGAGGNDISKGTNVGTWSATATAAGKVTVTYNLSAGYTLSEAHVNLKCVSAITKCAPGQYTYNAGTINDLSTYSTNPPLTYPSCSPGKVGLIIHAAVNVLTTNPTCYAATD